jgi:prephenate dehydrogenase
MIAKNLSIVGLGHVGASIALAVKASPFDVELVGYDESRTVIREAKAHQIVDKVESNLRKLAEAADILVLAVSFDALKRIMPVIGDSLQEHCLVLDVSNLKGSGLALAEKYMTEGHYVGAAPIYAAQWLVDGRQDVAAANAELFQQSVFCLMPSPKADPEAVETAVNFGLLIGAVPYFVDALEFDSLQTGVQTVPGLLAAALFGSVSKAAGWRDMLRFASVPFAMSTQPLSNSVDLAHEAHINKIATIRWLDGLIDELKMLRQTLYESEEEILAAAIEGLADDRKKWLAERQKNDWVEGDDSDMDTNLAMSRFLGIFGQRKKREEEED